MGAVTLDNEVGGLQLMGVTPGRAIRCETLKWKHYISPVLDFCVREKSASISFKPLLFLFLCYLFPNLILMNTEGVERMVVRVQGAARTMRVRGCEEGHTEDTGPVLMDNGER